MCTRENESTVFKLTDEKSWSTWIFQIKIAMKAKKYFEVVDGTKEKPQPDSLNYENNLKSWLEADCKAQEIIVSRLEKDLLHIF
jgi:hypothetical protein